jgi:hypothetical protein
VGPVMAGKPCRHADRHPRWDRRPRPARLEQGRDVPGRERSQRQAAPPEGGYAAFLHVHFLPWAVHSTASPGCRPLPLT